MQFVLFCFVLFCFVFVFFSQVKVLKARSGDRSLSLQTVSFKGFPILDVIDYKNKRRGERYIDRIMYKTPEIKKNEKNSGN